MQPAVAPNGTLTYTPAANANGAATITVNAHDNGGTASGGSRHERHAYRHDHDRAGQRRPELRRRFEQVGCLWLLGAQSVPGWATAVSPGPSDEAAQTVTFIVSASNPGLFNVQPAVAPNGTLTFTPKALALGSATVTVRAGRQRRQREWRQATRARRRPSRSRSSRSGSIPVPAPASGPLMKPFKGEATLTDARRPIWLAASGTSTFTPQPTRVARSAVR